MINNIILKYAQFIRFSFIGIINSCIAFITNAIAVYLLTELIINKDILAQIAAIIAFVTSSANGYLWNKSWVFSKSKTKNSFRKYYIAYGSTFIIGQTATYILTHYILTGYEYMLYLVPIPTMAITFLANFLLSKHWAFKHHS